MTNVFNYVKIAKPDYQYKRAVWLPEWLQADLYPYGNGNNQWFVHMETRSLDALTVLVLLVGIAIYWTLFTIWAIINAYYQKRLNIGWILLFALFNVVGYLIFRLIKKKE